MRGVFAVNDRDVDVQIVAQTRQGRHHGITAGAAHDVAEEEESHKGAKVKEAQISFFEKKETKKLLSFGPYR